MVVCMVLVHHSVSRKENSLLFLLLNHLIYQSDQEIDWFIEFAPTFEMTDCPKKKENALF